MDTRPVPFTRVMNADDNYQDDPPVGYVMPPEEVLRDQPEDRCPADETDMTPVRWSPAYARWEYTEDLTAV